MEGCMGAFPDLRESPALRTKVPPPDLECWVAVPPPLRPRLPMSSSWDSAPPATVTPGTRTTSCNWPKCVGWGQAGAASSLASTARALALGRGDLPHVDDAGPLPCG